MPSRLERLRTRRTDPLQKALGVNEVYARITEDDAVKYAIGAMQPIDPEYTANTFAEGDRVRDQLQAGLRALRLGAEFCYQGSVTSDTHIKAHSDIDLLTLHPAFFTVEPPNVPQAPYQGNPLDDLRSLRASAINILRKAFPKVTLEESPGGKALTLTGGSLQREIDVVVANWWHTVEYEATKVAHYRGIYIYDAKEDARIENKPFLHNHEIDKTDKAARGNLRKVIRLLKSLKYDADNEVKLSSYDIASIAYRMPPNFLNAQRGEELRLVSNSEAFLRQLLDNPYERDNLLVPNGMRRIFGQGAATEASLRQLHREVRQLIDDIERGLSRSFKKLAEARIAY